MINLKLDALEQVGLQDQCNEIAECGEQKIREAEAILTWNGIDLEAIDDDDQAAVDAARAEAEEIAGMVKRHTKVCIPNEIIEPPLDVPVCTIFTGEELPRQMETFEEIADEGEVSNSDYDDMILQLISELEGIF